MNHLANANEKAYLAMVADINRYKDLVGGDLREARVHIENLAERDMMAGKITEEGFARIVEAIDADIRQRIAEASQR